MFFFKVEKTPQLLVCFLEFSKKLCLQETCLLSILYYTVYRFFSASSPRAKIYCILLRAIYVITDKLSVFIFLFSILHTVQMLSINACLPLVLELAIVSQINACFIFQEQNFNLFKKIFMNLNYRHVCLDHSFKN